MEQKCHLLSKASTGESLCCSMNLFRYDVMSILGSEWKSMSLHANSIWIKRVFFRLNAIPFGLWQNTNNGTTAVCVLAQITFDLFHDNPD